MAPKLESERLVYDLVRLRRAAAACAHVDDLAAVSADLERVLGRAVTRAVAARSLGISQTALDKWIGRGDISTVLTPTGRRRVPLRELVELVDAVDEQRARRSAEPHPLAVVLRGRRAAVERLDPEKVLPRRYRARDRSGHRPAELRGLAYHRAVAQRLDPRILAQARARLHDWREDGRIDERHARRWERVLSQPIPSVARIISSDRESSRELRQSSPLTGILSGPERRRVLEIAGRR